MYFQYNRYVFVKKKNIKRRGFNFVETDYVRLLNNCNTELEYLLFVKKKKVHTQLILLFMYVYMYLHMQPFTRSAVITLYFSSSPM